MQWLGLGWVDTSMLGVIVFSAFVGLWRGFTLEFLSLAGWFAAYFAAQWLAPWIAPHVPLGAPGSHLNQGLAFASAFIVSLLLWGLAARVLAFLIGATPLRPLDRLLGAVFGVARGVIVLLVVATVLLYTPAGLSAAWQASQGAIWLNRVLGLVVQGAPRMPTDAAPGRAV